MMYGQSNLIMKYIVHCNVISVARKGHHRLFIVIEKAKNKPSVSTKLGNSTLYEEALITKNLCDSGLGVQGTYGSL